MTTTPAVVSQAEALIRDLLATGAKTNAYTASVLDRLLAELRLTTAALDASLLARHDLEDEVTTADDRPHAELEDTGPGDIAAAFDRMTRDALDFVEATKAAITAAVEHLAAELGVLA